MGSAAQGPNSLLGQSVGGYRLERMLGKGATGAVFLGRLLPETPRVVERTEAVATELPEEAAIKVLILPWQLEDDERTDFHARFVREGQTLQRLRHANIVSVLDYGDDPVSGFAYITLPYMRGGTLATQLAAHADGLPLDEIETYLRQIADALDYAHGEGVVHRDIKPGNILLDGKGQAYLSDFSIVRLLAETQTRLTSTGRVMGTPEYMSPEQFAGHAVGPTADIYSLGMVVYSLVTGRPAFSATSIVEFIRLQTLEPPPPPRLLRAELPEPAQAAILRALEKDPAQRYANAAAFAQAFAQGLRGQWAEGLTRFVTPGAQGGAAHSGAATTVAQALPADAQSTLTQRRAPRRRGMRLLAVAATLVLLVACVSGVVFAMPGNPVLALFTQRAPQPGATSPGSLAAATDTAAQTAPPSGSATTGAHPTATRGGGSGGSGGGNGGGGAVGGGGPIPTTGGGSQPTTPPQPGSSPTFTPLPIVTNTPTPAISPTATEAPWQTITEQVNSHSDATTYGGNTAPSGYHYVVVNVTMINNYAGTESFTYYAAGKLYIYNLPGAATAMVYVASFQTNDVITLASGHTTTVNVVFQVSNYNTGSAYAVVYIDIKGNWNKNWTDTY